MQTIAGQLGKKGLAAHVGIPSIRSTKELVQLPDGDALILDIDEPVCVSPTLSDSSSTPTVVTLHGLGGDSYSTYNLRLRQKFASCGFRLVRFNHRGCGRLENSSNLLPSKGIYHAGRSEDISLALKSVCKKWPKSPVVVIGFSLSGNALLQTLVRHADMIQANSNLLSACSVCAPLDLEVCSLALARQRYVILDKYYMRKMRRVIEQREASISGEQKTSLPKGVTLRMFDEIYTAPRGGFRDRSHYYEFSSAKNVVDSIKLPTLILGAKDDPIVPPVSYEGIKLSSEVKLDLQPSGGHMGFIQRGLTEFGDRRWMDSYLINWAKGVFSSVV